jgi:hypothetical protein
MLTTRMFPATLLVFVACGSTTPSPTTEPATESGPPKSKSPPSASATADPPPEDVASFAAAPEAVPYGSELRFTYEGATVKLTDSALVPVGKGYSLRYKQPAAEGGHALTLTTGELEPGKPASIEGALFLQLSDGKKADGSFKLLDVTASCKAQGTLTLAEAPKPGGKAKGSVDVTVTCTGVQALKSPFAIKGDFNEVPLRAK